MQQRSTKRQIAVGGIIVIFSIVDAFLLYFYLDNLTYAIVSCVAGISIGIRVIGKGYARLKAETK